MFRAGKLGNGVFQVSAFALLAGMTVGIRPNDRLPSDALPLMALSGPDRLG
jgi:hypothetical protein